MTKTSWLAIAGGLFIWSGFACSGQTESGTNLDSSSADGSSSEDSGSGTGGSGTTGNDTTSEDTSGQSSGTGGTNSASCPSVEPAVGSSCSPSAQSCSFINCVAPDYRDDHVMACINGAWALTSEVICDADPLPCPSSLPAQGQACDAASTPGPCSALDACGVVQFAYCTTGVWEFQSSDGAEDRAAPAPGTGGATVVGTATATTGADIPVQEPVCPANPPTLGAACCPASFPEYCDYGAGGAGGNSGFGAPAPGVGGATSGDASAVASSTAVGSFTATVTVTTTGATTGSSSTGGSGMSGSGGSGSGGSPPVVECVVCSENLVWEASDVCP